MQTQTQTHRETHTHKQNATHTHIHTHTLTHPPTHTPRIISDAVLVCANYGGYGINLEGIVPQIECLEKHV